MLVSNGGVVKVYDGVCSIVPAESDSILHHKDPKVALLIMASTDNVL